jgi:hypothetical protein
MLSNFSIIGKENPNYSKKADILLFLMRMHSILGEGIGECRKGRYFSPSGVRERGAVGGIGEWSLRPPNQKMKANT